MSYDATLNVRTLSARKAKIIALAGSIQLKTKKSTSSGSICNALLKKALENTSEDELIQLLNQS